jgi:hypothetical protein
VGTVGGCEPGMVLYWNRCARSMVSVDHAIGHSGGAMGYDVVD